MTLPIPDLVCLSHLRWNFVWQRPQHLMIRFARERRVFFIEEPIREEGPARIEIQTDAHGVHVVVPFLPPGMQAASESYLLERLLASHVWPQLSSLPVLWYYTPMALAFSRTWPAAALVYDCMDELTGFLHAPAGLIAYEAELLSRADLVFTGGHSLYEAKRHLHPSVFPFPSSVDRAHFARARELSVDPDDQAAIPRPRIGFFGVIDERLDAALVDAVAAARPDWHLVMLGPVVKIDPAQLPKRPNVHYLGSKPYARLPEYLAGWDVAMLPFARNDATRFISPTKTPEYLAAGRPVVSTSIRDVVRPYGELGLVHIADDPAVFVEAVAAALSDRGEEHLRRIDEFLGRMSWDATWESMRTLVDERVGVNWQAPVAAPATAAAPAAAAAQHHIAG